jgi:hypothetical protein
MALSKGALTATADLSPVREDPTGELAVAQPTPRRMHTLATIRIGTGMWIAVSMS